VRPVVKKLRSTLSQVTRGELLILLLVIFTVSASIELAYGSPYLGIGFFILGVLMLVFLTRDGKVDTAKYERSPLLMFLGASLVAADLVFNYVTASEIQTFDTMVILLGFSIGLYASGSKYSDIGKFSTYFSSIFLTLFLLLFMIPLKVSMYLPYLYGHYAVAVPVVLILGALELKLKDLAMTSEILPYFRLPPEPDIKSRVPSPWENTMFLITAFGLNLPKWSPISEMCCSLPHMHLPVNEPFCMTIFTFPPHSQWYQKGAEFGASSLMFERLLFSTT